MQAKRHSKPNQKQTEVLLSLLTPVQKSSLPKDPRGFYRVNYSDIREIIQVEPPTVSFSNR